MSQYSPFVFGAGGGQPPPALPHQQSPAQPPIGTLGSSQPQAAPTPAQQSAFQQNGQVSAADLAALQGISPQQLAALFRVFQSGKFDPPPDLPTVNSVPAPVPVPQDRLQAPGIEAPHGTDAFVQEQDVDMDRDEGEIDEVEEVESATVKEPRGFLHPPPTGPRKLHAPQLNQRKSSPRPPVPAPAANSEHSNDIQSKEFVLVLLKAGHSFHDILREVGNPEALARMFRQMRLEVPSEYGTTKDILAGSENVQAKDETVTKPTAKRAAPAKPPAPAKPVDRSAYLARLQAAKNKKADTNTIAPTPAHQTSDSKDPTLPDKESTGGASADGNTPKPAPKSREEITALAKQRLEAFKALQAAKQQAAAKLAVVDAQSSSSPQLSLPLTSDAQPTLDVSHPGLGAGLDSVGVRASQMELVQQPDYPSQSLHQTQPAAVPQALVSPPLPTPTRSFGGLPGLFMSEQIAPMQMAAPSYPFPRSASQGYVQASSFQANRTVPSSRATAATPTASSVTRKRPVASDFDYPATSKPRRPFGRSRGTSPDEPIIINNSDDEDEDDDADDEMDTDTAMTPTTKLSTASFRDVAPLRDFPGRPVFPMQASGPSTPGASTPGGATYEQRMKEIEDMKRKIAEAEKRKHTNGKITSEQKTEAGAPAIRSDAPSPTPRGSSGSTPKVVDLPLAIGTADSLEGVMYTGTPATASNANRTGISDRPMSAATLARYQEKERLKQRLHELQRNETRDVHAAVEAATQAPDSTAQPPSSNLDAIVQVASTPIVEETQFQGTTIEANDELDADEGEISDDFNFYEPDDMQGMPAEEPNARDQSNAGFLFSAGSDVDDEDQAMDSDETPYVDDSQPVAQVPDSLVESQPPSAENLDAEMADGMSESVGRSQPVATVLDLLTESQIPSVKQQESEMADSVSESVVPSQAVLEIEDDEDEGGEIDDDFESEESGTTSDDSDSDSDDDEIQELDKPAINEGASNAAVAVPEDLGADNESDDYEPEELRVEAAAEVAESMDQDAVPTAVSQAAISDQVAQDQVIDDELAAELQPTAEEQAAVVQQASASHHFKPYESALRGFKDYKWHPDFLATTSEGFKSMTYSHKIDLQKKLCPFEGAGGQCNDPKCEFQHFKDMGLTDNELLKQLGTHNAPVHSEAEQKRWNEGLGTVIKQLRLANASRDVNAIAMAIAEFRRDFIGDPTKVLNLG